MFQTWTEYLVIEKVDLRMTYVWCVIFRPMRTDREWRWSHGFVMCVRTRHVCGECSRTLCGLQRPSKAMTDFWLDTLHVSLATTGWWREKRSAGRERAKAEQASSGKRGEGGGAENAENSCIDVPLNVVLPSFYVSRHMVLYVTWLQLVKPFCFLTIESDISFY